jgi:hypothetical protein
VLVAVPLFAVAFVAFRRFGNRRLGEPGLTPRRSRDYAELSLGAICFGRGLLAVWHVYLPTSVPLPFDTAASLAIAGAGWSLLARTRARQHAAYPPEAPGGVDRFVAKDELKRDLFGRIELGHVDGRAAVRRDFRAGAHWLRPLAAVLARREQNALRWLAPVPNVPRPLDVGRGRFLRSYVEGRSLAEAGPRDAAYFAEARHLLRRIHALGVTHNDTHKIHNWLVTPEGAPALTDFQIAGRHAARTRWFRLCALEDIRHILKHKRTFCPEALTARERAILARRSWPARAWLATVKPVYVLVTRRLLGWRDAEGRGRSGGAR